MEIQISYSKSDGIFFLRMSVEGMEPATVSTAFIPQIVKLINLMKREWRITIKFHPSLSINREVYQDVKEALGRGSIV